MGIEGRLKQRGWEQDERFFDRWWSPYSLIDYNLKQACRIEGLKWINL